MFFYLVLTYREDSSFEALNFRGSLVWVRNIEQHYLVLWLGVLGILAQQQQRSIL